jgi:HlyD family secretion protein
MAKNGKSSWVKWVIILIVLAALAAGAVWYFKASGNVEVTYQSAPITRGDVTQAVSATGTLNPVVNVQVGSQISGIILKLYADYNTVVKSNQVVAELDPATYKASVIQAQGDLANAKANEELNAVEAKRAAELFTNSLISGSDFDTAIAGLHQAQAQVMIKEAALTNANVNLSRCTIYAPVDGVVISRSVDVGQTVAASLSAPVLFQVANDLTKMQIDAAVSEAEIGGIEETQAVTFTVDAFPGRNFFGKVVQIRNSATTVQNVVTYDVVIGVNNPDLKLRPGMTATASIVTAQRNNALKVPNAALRFKSLNEPKPAPTTTTTNAPGAKAGDTNSTEQASAEPPLTGNEPPDVLMQRVREMRERGEEIPENIRTKIREMFQNGTLQRPAGGGGGGGGQRNSGGGGGVSTKTLYILVTDASGNQSPQPVKVKLGISDGAYTEVVDGLKEGDVVITGAKYPQAASASAAPAGANPFGGGGGGGFGGGGGRGR